MKKIILMAAMAVMTSTAFAQLMTGKSAAISKEFKNKTFYLQWNPSSIVPDKGSSQSFTGFSIGLNKAWGVSSSLPLYIESGLGIQFSFYSEDDADYKMLSAKIPLSLQYVYEIPNSSVEIIPNLGLDFRINAVGTAEYNGKDYNLFDKDDMGGDDYTWNRFQVGWHIGANARFNKKWLVGVSYGTDFSEIAKKAKIHTTSVTLGVCF